MTHLTASEPLTENDPAAHEIDPPIEPLAVLTTPGPSPRRAFLLIPRTIERIKRGKPEAATSGFGKELRRQSEAPNSSFFLPRLPTVCKVGGRFASYRGSLPLLRHEVLRVPPVLAGPDILFEGVPPPGETPGSPGSAKTLPADPQGKEGPLPRGKPPSPWTLSPSPEKYG